MDFWDKTYAPNSEGSMAGATLSTAFSGWADGAQAVQDSSAIVGSLVGDKYISFGGSDAVTGKFTASILVGMLSTQIPVCCQILPRFFYWHKRSGKKSLSVCHTALRMAWLMQRAALVTGFLSDENVNAVEVGINRTPVFI